MAGVPHVLASFVGAVEKAKLGIEDNLDEAEHQFTGKENVKIDQLTNSALSEKKIAVLDHAKGPTASEEGNKFYEIEVQFNPRSLRLTSISTISREFSSVPTATAAGAVVHRPAGVSLRVNLMMDHINISDAFMTDTFGFNAGQMLSTAASLFKKSKGEKFSVYPQTTALFALAMCSETMRIRFCWGTFIFIGTLEDLQVNYTMFSPSGEPIRSLVGIRLMQEASASGGDMKYWENAYDRTLGKNREYGKKTAKDMALDNPLINFGL